MKILSCTCKLTIDSNKQAWMESPYIEVDNSDCFIGGRFHVIGDNSSLESLFSELVSMNCDTDWTRFFRTMIIACRCTIDPVYMNPPLLIILDKILLAYDKAQNSYTINIKVQL